MSDPQQPEHLPHEQLFARPKNFRTSSAHRSMQAAGVVPAFIRRARRLERAEQVLIADLERERDARLEGVVRQVKRLVASVGLPSAGELFTRPDAFGQVYEVAARHEAWPRCAPDSYWPPFPPMRARECAASVDRFRAQWERVLDSLDLTRINELVDGYNTYYPIEREMFRVYNSERDFEPRPAWTRARVAALVPGLPTLEPVDRPAAAGGLRSLLGI